MRQLISNAKLLVKWIQGKILIFSSATPSVPELRRPNDVADLSSMGRAKGALSKNYLLQLMLYVKALLQAMGPSQRPESLDDHPRADQASLFNMTS
ncbi:transcription factor Gaf1 [Sarracenia purpurea var. burkii]